MKKINGFTVRLFLFSAVLALGVSCDSGSSTSDEEGSGGSSSGESGGSGGSSKKCVITGKYDGDACDGGIGSSGITQTQCTSLESNYASLRSSLGSRFTCKAAWK